LVVVGAAVRVAQMALRRRSAVSQSRASTGTGWATGCAPWTPSLSADGSARTDAGTAALRLAAAGRSPSLEGYETASTSLLVTATRAAPSRATPRCLVASARSPSAPTRPGLSRLSRGRSPVELLMVVIARDDCVVGPAVATFGRRSGLIVVRAPARGEVARPVRNGGFADARTAVSSLAQSRCRREARNGFPCRLKLPRGRSV
jgi:hypothetical protein